MKTSSYIVFVLLCFYSVTKLYPQKMLSLDEAITIALNHNTNLVKNTNSLSSLESSIKSAYGNLLPNLNVSGGFSWQRVSDDGGTQIDFFGNPQIIEESQVDSRNWSMRASGNVTLFDGLANLATIDKSENDLKSAKFTISKLKQDIILQTISYYVQIISYGKLYSFQTEDLNYNTGLLNRVKEMYDLKMIPISDVYSQEAQTANSQLSLLQAKSNFEKAKIDLLNYLAIDVSQEYEFDTTATTNIDNSIAEKNIQDLYDLAFANRDDYKSMKITQTNAQNQLTIAKGSLFPSLSGNYGFSTGAIVPSDLFNRRTYSLGLSLNIPIFSNWNTENSIQAAKVQILNSDEDMKALELNIKSQVKNANLDVETAKLQLDASEIALTSSKQSWQIKKETYNLGSATYLDLQQAYNNYLKAEYTKISNEFKYIISKYSLLNKIGEI